MDEKVGGLFVKGSEGVRVWTGSGVWRAAGVGWGVGGWLPHCCSRDPGPGSQLSRPRSIPHGCCCSLMLSPNPAAARAVAAAPGQLQCLVLLLVLLLVDSTGTVLLASEEQPGSSCTTGRCMIVNQGAGPECTNMQLPVVHLLPRLPSICPRCCRPVVTSWSGCTPTATAAAVPGRPNAVLLPPPLRHGMASRCCCCSSTQDASRLRCCCCEKVARLHSTRLLHGACCHCCSSCPKIKQPA